jgi:hypothetical protein
MMNIIGDDGAVIGLALLAPLLFVLVVVVLDNALTSRPRRRY